MVVRQFAAVALSFLIVACGSTDSSPTDGGTAAGADTGTATDGGPGVDAGQDAGLEVDLCTEIPEGRVMLPADEAAHSEDLEWWYWTGHLHTADGRWFGFHHTFFLTHRGPLSGQVVHHAIADIDDDSFHHIEEIAIGGPPVVDPGFQFAVGAQTASGANGSDTLHGAVEGYTMDLALTAVKAPVFQHESGYTDYSFGGYTYYYSRERMAAEGTIVIDGETLPVTGSAWFDHQWGTLGPAVEFGWDWFALQLDDNREIMLFIVRVEGEDVFVGGSLSEADCMSTPIEPSEFEVTPIGEWRNAADCPYPSGWNVRVRDENYVVTPAIEDQELATTIKTYWEGAAVVSGDATGRAYVELTGYCD